MLTKSVISTIPIYSMMFANIAKSVWNEMGSSEDKFKIHLVDWNIVCQPKWRGKLGIKKLNAMNNVYLSKITWKFSTNDDSLWCMILKAKYLTNRRGLGPLISKSGDSQLWSHICK